MTVSRPSEFRAVEKLIQKGPATLILVWSPSCGHCHTYMPTWDKLTETSDRAVNMVKMKSETYNATPMSAKKPVEAVPTVLYVDTEGRVEEVNDTRNVTTMKNIIRTAAPESVANGVVGNGVVGNGVVGNGVVGNGVVGNGVVGNGVVGNGAITANRAVPNLPEIEVTPNPLNTQPATVIPPSDVPEIPRETIQTGGDPFSAFLLAAQQAAPAAMLLGAYSTLKKRRTRRSSGLPAPRRRRRVRFSRRFRK